MSHPAWIIDGQEAVNVGETETGDSGQQERSTMREECVCIFVMKENRKPKREWEARASNMTKTSFADGLRWKMSFSRQDEDHFPTNKPFKCLCLSMAVYVFFRLSVNIKREQSRKQKKSVGFELFCLSLTPSISQEEVSSSPWGPCCHH